MILMHCFLFLPWIYLIPFIIDCPCTNHHTAWIYESLPGKINFKRKKGDISCRLLPTTQARELKKHGDNAFPFLVSYERLSGYETGSFLWHWHPEIELTYVKKGEMLLQGQSEHLSPERRPGAFWQCQCPSCRLYVPESGLPVHSRNL